MTAAIIALVLLALPLVSAPSDAQLSPAPEVIEGRYLRIVSMADTAMQNMLPGTIAHWDVSVSAHAPTPGVVDLELEAVGDLPLVVDVMTCSEPWQSSGCAGIHTVVLDSHPVSLGAAPEELLSAPSTESLHLRFSASTLAEPGASVPAALGASTTLRIHAHGYDDELIVTPPGSDDPLASTGRSGLGVLLMAGGAVVAGIAGAKLLTVGARRKEETA